MQSAHNGYYKGSIPFGLTTKMYITHIKNYELTKKY